MNQRLKRTDEESGDGPMSDRQLLKQFVNHNDDRAFAELVSRYGGLVLDVCRRVLQDEHLAEDVFQATFLVLARRASRIRHPSPRLILRVLTRCLIPSGTVSIRS